MDARANLCLCILYGIQTSSDDMHLDVIIVAIAVRYMCVFSCLPIPPPACGGAPYLKASI